MSGGVVVVDTGVLLAAADADDRWHDEARELLERRSAEELVLPVPVAAEASWLIGARLRSGHGGRLRSVGRRRELQDR